MIFGTKQIVIAVTTLLTVSIVASGLWYITNLRAELAVSEMNTKQLKEAVDQQQQLISSIKEDVVKIQDANSQIQARVANQRKELAALQKRFKQSSSGEARDFSSISATKPKLVENIINSGTANAMRCLELASGASHTEKELSIKSADGINRECPALANPNYKPKS